MTMGKATRVGGQQEVLRDCDALEPNRPSTVRTGLPAMLTCFLLQWVNSMSGPFQSCTRPASTTKRKCAKCGWLGFVG